MKTWDLIRTANRNLFRNKLRTFLTVVAIFVGSFTLTMTNGLGDGMRDYVESQVKNIEGDRVAMVRRKIETGPNGANPSAPPEYKEDANADAEEGADLDPEAILLTKAQIDSVVAGIDGVTGVTPRYGPRGEYISVSGGKKYRLEMGMLSDGLIAKTEAGTMLNGPDQILIPIGLARDIDPEIKNLVGQKAVIGYKVPDGSIKTLELTVAGVMTKGFMTNRNSFVGTDVAKKIFQDQRTESGPERFIGFTVQVDSPSRLASVKKALDAKGFEAESVADSQKRTYDAIGIFKAGMNLFAMVALLAASFGIINTLVIAVLERTKEIGLQKALGMGRGKIFAIFSLESVLIGFWGALIGSLGAIGAGLITNRVLVSLYAQSFEGFSLFAFKPLSVAMIMLLVCGIAFIAGVMPAIRASRLNPIESLRYE